MVAAPANPVSERPPVTAAPAVLAEKASLPTAATPVNPETPTGSVEIIADPYPSIHAPAEPNARASRPAAFSIGTLVSKVEPVRDILAQLKTQAEAYLGKKHAA